MQTFKGFVLSTFLLLLGIISLGEASAQDFYFTDRPGPGQQRKFEIEEQVSRYVDGSSQLALRNILNLDQNARGLKLVKIELFASSSSSYATAQLELNGRALGFAQNVSWRYDQSVVFEIPAGDRVIGRDIQTLKLRLQGSMYVDKVVATLKDDGQGPGQVGGQNGGRTEWVSSFEHQRFYSQLPLKQALKLNRQHEGKILKQVVLKGYPVGQRVTSVQLVVDGRAVGHPQYLDRQYSQQVQIVLNSYDQVRIAQGDSIKLVFDGEIMFTELAAELEVSNELRIQVNQRVSGERVFLDQFLRLAAADAVKKFEKIIIRGHLMGRASNLRACARGFAAGAACDHTRNEGHFELTLDKFEMQAADVFLMARGEAVVSEVILVGDKKAPHQYPF